MHSYTRRPLLVAIVALSCLAPSASAMRALYAGDPASNQTLGYAVASDGVISSIPGFPLLSAQGPSALVPTPDGIHLYAAFPAANAVGIYDIGADGSLTASPAAAAGTTPTAAAVSPDGSRLYVANSGSNTISGFRINAGGSLSSFGSATATGSQPSGIAMTPDGSYLYVSNTADDTLSSYSVSSTGGLQPLGDPTPSGDGPTGLAVTPDGAHLFATNATAGTVSGWTIAADGSLSSVGPDVAAGAGAHAIAVSPDGTRVLVANAGDSTVSRYTLAPTGALSIAGDATSGPTGSMSIAISPDGAHAYVGGPTSIGAFDFSSAAELTARSGFAAGAAGAIAITPNQGPRAKFNATAGATGQPSVFQGETSIDPDGGVAGWHWDFGDGSAADGVDVSHSYQQPGTYAVTLTVVDNEGCSTHSVYTGQAVSCAGVAPSKRTIIIADPEPNITPDPPCIHDGNDGFCGTPDLKAPRVEILGVTNGSQVTTLDAPDAIVGSVTPDPSGISQIRLRFMKAAGTSVKKKVVTKKVCRKVKGKTRRKCRQRPLFKKTCKKVRGKRRCQRTKVVKLIRTSVCLAVDPSKNFLVERACDKAPWIDVPGDVTFRYDLPLALGTGTYTAEALATDGAGNSDVPEDGRNHITFKVIATPSNSGDSSGGTIGTDGGTSTTPINDTGSPFGRR